MKMEIDQRQFLEEITSTWLILEAAEKPPTKADKADKARYAQPCPNDIFAVGG